MGQQLNPRARLGASAPVPIQRARIRFARLEAASNYSHLQQIEVIRKALVQSSWPLSLTQGKKSKPRVSFGPAISVGYESECEYCDVELQSRLDMNTAKENLEKNLAPGFYVRDIKSIPRFFPSLEQSLNVARYEIRSPLLNGTEDAWGQFWKASCFMVTKKKQDGDVAVDARPIVRSWKLEGDVLELFLRFGPGRTLKPEKIIQAVCHLNDEQIEMGVPTSSFKIKRVQMYFEKQNGDLAEL